MSKEITSKSRRVTSVVIGVITTIVLIALLAVLVMLPGSKQWWIRWRPRRRHRPDRQSHAD